MSTVSIPKKCPLCGLGELAEFGHTALPKRDPDSKAVDMSQILVTRIVTCNHCGYLVLLRI